MRWKMAMPLALFCSAAAALATPALVQAQSMSDKGRADALQDEIASRVGSELRQFYAGRGFRPIWISANGKFDPAIGELLKRVETAQVDAIRARKLNAGSLRKRLRSAHSGKIGDLARAELQLSETLARYIQETRRARRSEMIYESEALAPVVPTPAAALRQAASGSLAAHIATMGWMHPFYAPMRDSLLDRQLSSRQRAVIWENLDRIRALPGTASQKYVLVDAAGARLWMYEDGRPVDSMRVVVGKAETPTPMMAGFMRFAIVNPYWNIPPDLVQNTIAPNVVDKGVGYLKSGGYEALSDWSAKPAKLDAKSIDWAAVAAGTKQVRVRQLPGGSNFMGKVKFEFPNPQGIYLHDTPNKALLREDARQLSNGCVRLEDAQRFGRWLLDKPLPRRGSGPEQRINLPQLVPVYITYLTAMPEDGKIAFRSDPYHRDRAPMLAVSD